MKLTVKTLEEEAHALGLKVHTDHHRELWFDEKTPKAKGGVTVVTLIDEHNTVLAMGVANCSPRDNYNKRLGRTIALGRAMKELKEPREE